MADGLVDNVCVVVCLGMIAAVMLFPFLFYVCLAVYTLVV